MLAKLTLWQVFDNCIIGSIICGSSNVSSDLRGRNFMNIEKFCSKLTQKFYSRSICMVEIFWINSLHEPVNHLCLSEQRDSIKGSIQIYFRAFTNAETLFFFLNVPRNIAGIYRVSASNFCMPLEGFLFLFVRTDAGILEVFEKILQIISDLVFGFLPMESLYSLMIVSNGTPMNFPSL